MAHAAAAMELAARVVPRAEEWTALEVTAAWEAAPGATVTEIAWALRLAGCETRLAGPEHLAIIKDGVAVAHLALTEKLRAATLRAPLVTLGISPERFAGYLADPSGVGEV